MTVKRYYTSTLHFHSGRLFTPVFQSTLQCVASCFAPQRALIQAIASSRIDDQKLKRVGKRSHSVNVLAHFPNGGRSSMVELQIVILAVAGSSPVGHPTHSTLLTRVHGCFAHRSIY